MIYYQDFRRIFNVNDKNDWVYNLRVDQKGVWVKPIPEVVERLHSFDEIEFLLEHPQGDLSMPALAFPASIKQVESFLKFYDIYYGWSEWDEYRKAVISEAQEALSKAVVHRGNSTFISQRGLASWIVDTQAFEDKIYDRAWDVETEVLPNIQAYVKNEKISLYDKKRLGRLPEEEYQKDALLLLGNARELIAKNYPSLELDQSLLPNRVNHTEDSLIATEGKAAPRLHSQSEITKTKEPNWEKLTKGKGITGLALIAALKTYWKHNKQLPKNMETVRIWLLDQKPEIKGHHIYAKPSFTGLYIDQNQLKVGQVKQSLNPILALANKDISTQNNNIRNI